MLSAIVGLLPFATTYGLIYWAEQYVTSGLTSVLFGVLPLYVALLAAATLPEEPLRPRLLVGVGIALGGLVVAFSESLDLGVRRVHRAGGAGRDPLARWRARSATSRSRSAARSSTRW